MKATDNRKDTETFFGVTFQDDGTPFFMAIKDIHDGIAQVLEKISHRANI